MNDFIVHRVGITPGAGNQQGVTRDTAQIVTRNGGGFDQGLMSQNGRFGGIPVGRNGIIFAGFRGVGVMTAHLELEIADGTFRQISDTISTANTEFVITPGVRGNIPSDAYLWLNILTHTSGTHFYYMETA